jgi:LmbE family N-acetylglucosaminyl deacetylase
MSDPARGGDGPRSDNVLAVFAHPDDEVLCAGGTLALCAARGQHVTLVCATRGELGPVAEPKLLTGATLGAVRERELMESCATLGIADVCVLGLPDAGVHWAARDRSTLGALVHLIRRLRPAAIVTFGPDGLYGHPDHVAIGEVVCEARDAAADPGAYAEQLAAGCEAHAQARLFFPVITATDIAALFADMKRENLPDRLWSLTPADFMARATQVTSSVDVTSVLDKKLAALRCHRTQLDADNLFRHIPHEVAARFFGVERFRCADGLAGDLGAP